jgi:hypothetical protein
LQKHSHHDGIDVPSRLDRDAPFLDGCARRLAFAGERCIDALGSFAEQGSSLAARCTSLAELRMSLAPPRKSLASHRKSLASLGAPLHAYIRFGPPGVARDPAP